MRSCCILRCATGVTASEGLGMKGRELSDYSLSNSAISSRNDLNLLQTRLFAAATELQASVYVLSPWTATQEQARLRDLYIADECSLNEVCEDMKGFVSDEQELRSARQRSRLVLSLTWNSALIHGFSTLHTAEKVSSKVVGGVLSKLLRLNNNSSKRERREFTDSIHVATKLSSELSKSLAFLEDVFSKMELSNIVHEPKKLNGVEICNQEEYLRFCQGSRDVYNRVHYQTSCLLFQLMDFISEVKKLAPSKKEENKEEKQLCAGLGVRSKSIQMREQSDTVWRMYSTVHDIQVASMWESTDKDVSIISDHSGFPVAKLIHLLECVATGYRPALGLGVGSNSIVSLAGDIVRAWFSNKEDAIKIAQRELEAERGRSLAIARAIDEFRFLDKTSRGHGVVICSKSEVSAAELFPNTWRLLTFLQTALVTKQHKFLSNLIKNESFSGYRPRGIRLRQVDDVQCARFLKKAVMNEHTARSLRSGLEEGESAYSFISCLTPQESFEVALFVGRAIQVENEKRRKAHITRTKVHINTHSTFITVLGFVSESLTSHLESVLLDHHNRSENFISLSHCTSLLTAFSGTNMGGDMVYCISDAIRRKLLFTQQQMWKRSVGSVDNDGKKMLRSGVRGELFMNGVPVTAMLQLLTAVSNPKWTNGPLFGFSHQFMDVEVEYSVFKRHQSQLICDNVVKCALSHSALISRKLTESETRRRKALAVVASKAFDGDSSTSLTNQLYSIRQTTDLEKEKYRRAIRRLKTEWRASQIHNTRSIKGFLSLYKELLQCCQQDQLQRHSNVLSRMVTVVNDTDSTIDTATAINCEGTSSGAAGKGQTFTFSMLRHVVAKWERQCAKLGSAISKRLFNFLPDGRITLKQEHHVSVAELQRFLNTVSKFSNMPSPDCCVLERTISAFLLNDTNTMSDPRLSGIALSYAARFGTDVLVLDVDEGIPTEVCLRAVRDSTLLFALTSERTRQLLPVGSKDVSVAATSSLTISPTPRFAKLGTEHRVHTLLAHHAEELHPKGFLAAMTLVNPHRASMYRRQISALTSDTIIDQLSKEGSLSKAEVQSIRSFVKNEVTPQCDVLPEAIPIKTQEILVSRLTEIAPSNFCSKSALTRILRNVVSSFDVRALSPTAMSDLFHLFNSSDKGGGVPNLTFRRKIWLLEALAVLERRVESASESVRQYHHVEVASYRYPLVKSAVVDSIVRQIKSTSARVDCDTSIQNVLHVSSSEGLTLLNLVEVIRVLKLADAFTPQVFSRLCRFFIATVVTADGSEDPLSSNSTGLAISDKFAFEEDGGKLASNGNFSTLFECFAALSEEFTSSSNTTTSLKSTNKYRGSQFDEVLWPVFRSAVIRSGSRFSLKECTYGLKAFSHLDLGDTPVVEALVRRVEQLFMAIKEEHQPIVGDSDDWDLEEAAPLGEGTSKRNETFSRWVSSLDSSTCVALLGSVVGSATEVLFVQTILPMLVHHLLAIGTTKAPVPIHLVEFHDPSGARMQRTPTEELRMRDTRRSQLLSIMGKSGHTSVSPTKIQLVEHLYPVDLLHLIPAELIMMQHAHTLGISGDVPLIHSLYEATRSALLIMFGRNAEATISGAYDLETSPSVASVPVAYFVAILKRLVHIGLKDDELIDLCLAEVTRSGHRLETLDKQEFVDFMVAALTFRGAVEDWPHHTNDPKESRKSLFKPLVDHLWFYREHGLALDTDDKSTLLRWMKYKFGMVDDDVVLRLGMSPSTLTSTGASKPPPPAPQTPTSPPMTVESELDRGSVVEPSGTPDGDGDFWNDVLMLDD